MILVISKNHKEASKMQRTLAGLQYKSEIMTTIERLDDRLQRGDGLAVFIDIDSVTIGNRGIRKLTINHPSTNFFCMSRKKFHPELKEALCYHIYACLNKPIDPDELRYWLRCIAGNKPESRDPPQTDLDAKRTGQA